MLGAPSYNTLKIKQESCAIAKMTAQCAQYMGALKICRDSLTTPTATFPKIVWAFVPMVYRQKEHW